MSRRNELQSFSAKTSRDIYSIIQSSGSRYSVVRIRTTRTESRIIIERLDAQTSLFRRSHRAVPAADLDRANPHTGPTSAAFQAPRDATPVGASVCASCHQDVHAEWKSGRHSKMIQPANAASVDGDFSQARITLRGQPFQLRVANGAYFITESNITGTPARASRRVHARQPAHPALPDHDRERPDHRADAKLGRRAARLVRQHGDRPSGRRRSNAGAAVEQELRRLPRQRAGQPLSAGDARLRDRVFATSAPRASGATVPAARTSPSIGTDAAELPPPIARSSVRPGSIRPPAA